MDPPNFKIENVNVMWCNVDFFVEHCGCNVEQCGCNVDLPHHQVLFSTMSGILQYANVDPPHLRIDNWIVDLLLLYISLHLLPVFQDLNYTIGIVVRGSKVICV